MKVEAASLATEHGIKHAFFTREGGVSGGIYSSLNGGVGSNDNSDAVAENRARMAQALGVAPDRFLTAYQIHSPDVVIADTPWTHAERPRVDAIVTRVPGLAIGVSTADCGPLLFSDESARVIGAAHAGWRGAFTGVIEATLGAMEKLGAHRQNIRVVLGPLIRQKSYEVGPEFVARFVDTDPANQTYFAPSERTGHAWFDLPGYIGRRVREAGVERFEDLGLCTYSDPQRFFSYRRTTQKAEPDYGRHINAIVLTP